MTVGVIQLFDLIFFCFIISYPMYFVVVIIVNCGLWVYDLRVYVWCSC